MLLCRRWRNSCWKCLKTYPRQNPTADRGTIRQPFGSQADIAKAEKSLAALIASQAAGKSSCTQVAFVIEVFSVKFRREELKAWTRSIAQSRRMEPTDTRTHCSRKIQVLLKTPTRDLKGFDMMTAFRLLAEQEHFAALAQLRSRISPITKFGADADNDPFVNVKDLITDLIRLQAQEPADESEIPLR